MTQRSLLAALIFMFVVFGGSSGEPVRAQATGLNRPAPDISGETWINSSPLTMNGLRGRAVLVEFWTYG